MLAQTAASPFSPFKLVPKNPLDLLKMKALSSYPAVPLYCIACATVGGRACCLVGD